MKIAQFRRLGEHSYETIQTSCFDDMKGYVRLTEYVDVEFPPLKDDAVVAKHIKALDDAEAEVRTRFQQLLDNIEQQRQELRAISYQA